MNWTDLPVHVIDFEGSARTGVVEFGVVTLVVGEVRAVATRLCRARAGVSADEMRVHGLSEAQLAPSDPFETEWPRFAGWRESGVLAAHFSGTENALLRATWPTPRLSPDFLEPGRESAEWGPWIDTGRLAAELLPRAPSAGLEDVVATLGLAAALDEAATRWCPAERRHFHGALFDALACALVLRVLARDGDGAPWSLARLVAASTADVRRRDDRRQSRLF